MLPYFRLHHRRLFQQCLLLRLLSVRPVLRYCPDFLCLLSLPRLFLNVNDPLDKSDHLRGQLKKGKNCVFR